MRLVMTLLVRDEVDVVESMLEAHLALGVDHFIATDNRSVDGTTEILERYRRRGLLDLIHEPSDDYAQSRWVTRMARQAAHDGADWVINADADEFWLPRSGDLKSVLSGVPEGIGMVVAKRRNFVTRPDDGRPFFQRMRWRRTDSLTHDGMEMGPKTVHRASQAVDVAMGNHSVAGVPGGVLDDDRIDVLHFPLRSYEQYARKIEIGAAAIASNPAFGPEVCRHWRRSEQLRAAGELEAEWWSWSHDDGRLAADLAAGTVVEDTRVLDLLARTGESFPGGARRRGFWRRRR